MKRAGKKPKQNKVTMTEKQIEKIKDDVRRDVLDKMTLLILAAVSDTIAITDDEMCKVMMTVNRYSNYLDDHLVKLKDVQNTIEKNTGLKLKGWS